MADEAEDTAAGTHSIDTQPVPTDGIDRAECDPGQLLLAGGDVDLDAILQGLEAEDGELPEAAILAARKHSTAITPKLIEAIETATATLRRGEPFDGNVPFYAFHLLAEFKAKQALPAIVQALSLPFDDVELLFSEAVTDVGPRVFAILAAEVQELVDSIIDNRALSSRVRCAAIDSLRYLVRDEVISRDAAVERLRRHLRTSIDRRDLVIVGYLVYVLSLLYPVEAHAEIDEAFHQNLVDLRLINKHHIAEALARGVEGMVEDQDDLAIPTSIDVFDEIQGWMFGDLDDLDGSLDDMDLLDDMDANERFGETDDFGAPVMESMLPPPIDQPIRAERHPGRNDPCSCGSGKKYKKCCGAPGKTK